MLYCYLGDPRDTKSGGLNYVINKAGMQPTCKDFCASGCCHSMSKEYYKNSITNDEYPRWENV